jgi:DNA-directed RNA polymerase subunit RPC12/RpoP
MVETQTSYKCSACGMTKTIPTDQKAPSCCGKVMQKTAAEEPGKSKEGSCCSG